MNETHFTAHFAQLFERSTFVRLARQTGWLRRQGKIDAFEFLVGLVFGQLSALRLTLSAQAACGTAPVTRQAVDQRYHARAVDYFHAAFDHCLQQSLAHQPPRAARRPGHPLRGGARGGLPRPSIARPAWLSCIQVVVAMPRPPT